MCFFSAPKAPAIPKASLPRQPIIAQKPATFRPQSLAKRSGSSDEESAGIGFGATGRAGVRGLRIKRLRTDAATGLGNIAQTGNVAGVLPLSIGAQVPV